MANHKDLILSYCNVPPWLSESDCTGVGKALSWRCLRCCSTRYYRVEIKDLLLEQLLLLALPLRLSTSFIFKCCLKPRKRSLALQTVIVWALFIFFFPLRKSRDSDKREDKIISRAPTPTPIEKGYPWQRSLRLIIIVMISKMEKWDTHTVHEYVWPENSCREKLGTSHTEPNKKGRKGNPHPKKRITKSMQRKEDKEVKAHKRKSKPSCFFFSGCEKNKK